MNRKTLNRRILGNGLRSMLRNKLSLIMVLLFLVSGCTYYQKKIKTYFIGQEQSLFYPLRQVMLISGRSLEDLSFTVVRMEFLDQGGLIQAVGKDKEITLRLDLLAPRLTRLRGEVFARQGMRDFSSEEEVFKHIGDLLAQDKLPRLKEMTAKMIPVYQTPDMNSRVIAYLAPGVEVFIKGDEKEWSKVDLVSGGNGYVLTGNLNPIPFETAMDDPEA